MKKDNPSNATYSRTFAFLKHRCIHLSRIRILWIPLIWISYFLMDLLLTAKHHQLKTNRITQVMPIIEGHLPFFSTNLFPFPRIQYYKKIH